jgi:hypothetical protein
MNVVWAVAELVFYYAGHEYPDDVTEQSPYFTPKIKLILIYA